MLVLATNSLWSLFTGALALALISGYHCAGMCGAIAALSPSRSQIFLYQLGRLITYVSLGALSGYLGHRFYLGLEGGAGLVGSGVILLIGASLLFFGNFGSYLSKTIWRWIPGSSPNIKSGLLGLFNGLLPCHLLYSFFAVAAASGSAAMGALVLSALWIGSSPYLFAFSWLGTQIKKYQWYHQNKWIPTVIRVVLFLALMVGLIGHQLGQHYSN